MGWAAAAVAGEGRGTRIGLAGHSPEAVFGGAAWLDSFAALAYRAAAVADDTMSWFPVGHVKVNCCMCGLSRPVEAGVARNGTFAIESDEAVHAGTSRPYLSYLSLAP